MADIETHVIRVGADPEQRTVNTDDGEVELVSFYGYETQSYDTDKHPDLSMSVAVWNEALQPGVLEKVYKGAYVAVQGSFKTENVKGKTYRKMSAHRVGIVQWIPRAKQETAAEETDTDGDEDDDLDW